jgi:hypothetical protein
MPKTTEFWQYAEETILSAHYAESDEERQALLDLAQTWTQAALIERRARGDALKIPIAA